MAARTSAKSNRDPAPASARPTTIAGPATICTLLFIATFAAFWPALHLDFVDIDDPLFVTDNVHVLQGLTWDGIKWAFQFGHGDYWHPMTWLSLMTDVTLFGRGPAGFHAVNVLIHAANSILLFLLLWRWTGALWRSAVVAALFALHPLQVESVAWITERKDVLSTLFALLTLWAYSRYANESNSDKSRAGVQSPKSKVFYGVALFFFALALMSKAVVVTLPFALLLLDYWPLNRISGAKGQVSGGDKEGSLLAPLTSRLPRLIVEKIPFFALSAVFSWLIHFGQTNVAKPILTLSDLPGFVRIETVFVTYARYLARTLWPTKLAAYYQHPWRWPTWQVIVSVVLVVALCLLAIRMFRRRPYVFVGWFWFLGMLTPMMGITRDWHQFMADRFTYVPLIGLFILLAWGISDVLVSRLNKYAIGALAGAVLLACLLRTQNQVRYWQDTGTLFRHAIAVGQNSYLASERLGDYLARHGHLDEAITVYQEALKIHPDTARRAGAWYGREQMDRVLDRGDAMVRNDLGTVFMFKGRFDDALKQFSEAARLRPDHARAYNNLGNAFMRLQRPGEALENFSKALAIDPRDPEALSNVGVLLAVQGRVDEAIGYFTRSLEIQPDSAGTHNNLANALEEKGRPSEAIVHYREVVRLSPASPEAHFQLARLLGQLGTRDEAIAEATEALRLKPGYEDAAALLQELRAGKLPGQP